MPLADSFCAAQNVYKKSRKIFLILSRFLPNPTTGELTNIDPVLKIYHDCDDGIMPGQRKVGKHRMEKRLIQTKNPGQVAHSLAIYQSWRCGPARIWYVGENGNLIFYIIPYVLVLKSGKFTIIHNIFSGVLNLETIFAKEERNFI